MGKGYIGESRGERAMNKIVNYIERQDRKRRDDEPQKYEGNSLVDQLKLHYGKDWELELEEIRREHRDPEYKAKKDQVRQKARAAYWAMPRREREDLRISEGQYIARTVAQWRKDYR